MKKTWERSHFEIKHACTLKYAMWQNSKKIHFFIRPIVFKVPSLEHIIVIKSFRLLYNTTKTKQYIGIAVMKAS